MIGERTQEGESAGDVIVGDDEGFVQFVMHVVPDLSQLFLNFFHHPAFEWAAQINTDDFTENTGIDTFEIIVGERHGYVPFWG